MIIDASSALGDAIYDMFRDLDDMAGTTKVFDSYTVSVMVGGVVFLICYDVDIIDKQTDWQKTIKTDAWQIKFDNSKNPE